ncbi:bombyxin A-1 homolog [Ostrinia nubilalis]|uniref:bombyxin A-1 homolog n=1 Tax=Ostrinia nubilalis TaxID=29057 RepID=UPI0030825E94
MKNQVLILLIALSFIAAGFGQSQSQFFCGRRLANTLANLCPATGIDKRGGMNSIENFGYAWPWLMPRAKALQGRAKRDGVVSECCEKPCTINELMSYC